MQAGILSTSQKRDNGGGIVVAGARNGVSVDSSGYIVLGNDVNEDAAKLLSDREIPMEGFGINLTDLLTGAQMRISMGRAPDTNMIDALVTDAGGLDNGGRWAEVHGAIAGFLDGLLIHNEDGGDSSYSQIRITTDGQFYTTRLGVYNRFHASFPNTGFLLTTNEIFNIGNEDGSQNTIFRWLCGGHIFQTIFQDRLTLSSQVFNAQAPLFITSDDAGGQGIQINFRAISFPADSNSAISFASGGGIFYGSSGAGDLNIYNDSATNNGRVRFTGANVNYIIPKNNGDIIGFQFRDAADAASFQLLDVNINSGEMRVGGIGGSGHYVGFWANGAQRGLIDLTGGVPFWNFKTAIQTADPGSGVAKWMIGGVVAGAVALDAANYVEVNINGSVVKLLIAA